MAMTEDLSPFFNTSEFGETATLTQGAVSTAGTVIYDENGAVLESYGVEAGSPAVLCSVAQWPAVAPGDGLVIAFAGGAASYLVRSAVKLDDGALQLLALARAFIGPALVESAGISSAQAFGQPAVA